MKFLIPAAIAASSLFAQGTIFVGAWQKQVLVIDEAKQQIIDRIPLTTGTPRGLSPSIDRKSIYVTTWDSNGIEVIDVATRKVTNAFSLDEGNKRVNMRGMAADPTGKTLYTAIRVAEKKIDRFELQKVKFATISLVDKKISKTYDLPADEDPIFGGGGGYRVSPDGKYLYIFRDKIYIYDTTDFKQIDKIDLQKPELPWMANIGFGGGLYDPMDNDPNTVVALFNTSDPIVRRRIFGIARFDLTKRTFEFQPVGPSATSGMAGLYLTPDHKTGYTAAFFGGGPSRKTEFWVFDIATGQITRKSEFESRTRFSFAASSDGRKLYIFGAGFELEIYDARTLQRERVVDFNADMTTNMLVLPGR
jgi:YVTN family beta-propeller protein